MARIERRETADGTVRWTARVFLGREPVEVERKEGRSFRERLTQYMRDMTEEEQQKAFLVADADGVETSRHRTLEDAEKAAKASRGASATVWLSERFPADADGPLVTFTRTAGKRKFVVSTHDRKKDAEAEARRLESLKDGGALPQRPSKESLSSYLSDWLDAKESQIRARTIHDYRGIIRRYVESPPEGAPPIGTVQLKRLSSDTFDSLYGWLWREKKLAPRTIRYLHTVLRQALGDAVAKGKLIRNPTDHATVPARPYDEGEGPDDSKKPAGKVMRAMSEAEAGAFLKAAKNDRYYALWALLLTGGLRPGEALGLVWDDVDLKEGRVHIRRALTRTGVEGWRLTEPKTDRARRVVPLPQVAVQALRTWKPAQARERLKLGSEYQDTGEAFVFTTEFGAPLDGGNIMSRNFRRIMAKAELGTWETARVGKKVKADKKRFRPAFRMYDLRHTCATLLLKKGIAAKIVSERLGHASIKLTLDTYSHVLPDMQGSAVEALDAVFGG